MPLFSPTSPACWPRPRPSWPCGRRTGRSSSPTSGTWGANGAETRAGGGEIRRTLREEKTRTTSFERNLALARGACSRFFDSLNLLSNSVSLSCKKNQHPQNRTAFDLWSAFGLEVPLSLGGEGEVRERGVEKRGETFFSSLCSSFFFLPWSLWQRRAARPPPRVGEFSTRSSSFSLSPRSPLPPLSPNRPSSGLHDVRPFTLGDPDLHSGRGQVGTLEFFFVFWRFSFFFFFFPSSSSASVEACSLLRFYLPLLLKPDGRNRQRAISRPFLPRLLPFDAGGSGTRRVLPDKAEKGARGDLRGGQVRGGRMRDFVFFSCSPACPPYRKKNPTRRRRQKSREGGGEREKTPLLTTKPFFLLLLPLSFPHPLSGHRRSLPPTSTTTTTTTMMRKKSAQRKEKQQQQEQQQQQQL